MSTTFSDPSLKHVGKLFNLIELSLVEIDCVKQLMMIRLQIVPTSTENFIRMSQFYSTTTQNVFFFFSCNMRYFFASDAYDGVDFLSKKVNSRTSDNTISQREQNGLHP